MTEHRDYRQDLASIRLAMERSVKFLSLSGLSGVLAGLYALAGAALAWRTIYFPHPPYGYRQHYINDHQVLVKLIIVAAIVLLLSLATGYYMSQRKAKKLGVSIWNKTSRDFLGNLFIPLISGGLFIIIIIYRGYFALIAPACLIFYGLALINASLYSVREIRYLGFSEIFLGILAALWPGYGLILWSVGFGLLHIIYGLRMYYRYDREKSI
ncbi:MAG: hypothetical protein NZM13_12525 [Cyclobacteriaceae bacterium]|nr:hypothetical protein [Cyclobacteriaceae bacterium]